jgi:hypothetical protein
MPANAANPALGTAQSPGPPASPGEAKVACAIHCCDKEPYELSNNRGGKNTCQRLSKRKDACVVRKLREMKGDKLTTKNKFDDVLASPRCSAPGISRTLIPDNIVLHGEDVVAIDSKWPCDPSKVKFGKSVVNPSDSRTGLAMTTGKEADEYPKITKPVKVTESKAMTPADTKELKDKDCTCSKKK